MTVELQQAVYATQTNYVLKRMINNFDNSLRNDKTRFIKFLNVDIKNCEPIYFNDMKYSKARHENCRFFFLDEEFKIIGILRGNLWNESVVEEYEHYSYRKKSTFNQDGIIKNRKNLTEAATHILMITKEMENKLASRAIKPKPRFISKAEAKKELLYRLTDYKRDKFKDVDHEEIIVMLKQIMNYFMDELLTYRELEKEEKFCRKFHDPIWFAGGISDLIRGTNDIMKDYVESYNSLNFPSQRYVSRSYVEEKLKEAKVKIIRLNNLVEKEMK